MEPHTVLYIALHKAFTATQNKWHRHIMGRAVSRRITNNEIMRKLQNNDKCVVWNVFL